MKVSKIKNRLPLFAATLVLLATSACNRGVGCPTNFSLNDSLLDTVVSLVKVLF